MYELDNQTNWPANLYPGWGNDGSTQMILVFKLGYSFDQLGKTTPLAQTPAIVEEDQYTAEPGQSSLKAASEIMSYKKGSELILTGTVHPPSANTLIHDISLGLRMADADFWEKKLRLFGPRQYQKSLLGAVVGKPQAIDTIPLTYEYAYGGSDPNNESKIYEKNPVGRGYSEKGWRLKKIQLPQIEQGPKFISTATTRVEPAGFGPIPAYWPPRLDQHLQLNLADLPQGGCPYPENCPMDLHNTAPSDQRFTQHFTGKESIRLKGLIPKSPADGTLINLPGPRPQVILMKQDKPTIVNPVCDTMLIDIDRQQLILTYRLALPDDPADQTTTWLALLDLDQQDDDNKEAM